MCEKGVTTEQFVRSMLEYHKLKPDTEMWYFGRNRGWLEEQDELWAQRAIEKRQAARIVHEFMRREWKEPDERNVRKAQRLEDLYHCRVCANHVAQVYIKGLIKAKSERRFGLLDHVSEKEMADIFQCMSNRRIKNTICE